MRGKVGVSNEHIVNPLANCKSKKTLEVYNILHADQNAWSPVINPLPIKV